MPIYEYTCRRCSHSFELMRKMAQADESAPCPSCASTETNRMVSRVNAITGGGGEAHAASSGGGTCGTCSSCNCGSCHH